MLTYYFQFYIYIWLSFVRNVKNLYISVITIFKIMNRNTNALIIRYRLPLPVTLPYPRILRCLPSIKHLSSPVLTTTTSNHPPTDLPYTLAHLTLYYRVAYPVLQGHLPGTSRYCPKDSGIHDMRHLAGFYTSSFFSTPPKLVRANRPISPNLAQPTQH